MSRRYGITIADLAVECAVKHLVYSPAARRGDADRRSAL